MNITILILAIGAIIVIVLAAVLFITGIHLLIRALESIKKEDEWNRRDQ